MQILTVSDYIALSKKTELTNIEIQSMNDFNKDLVQKYPFIKLFISCSDYNPINLCYTALDQLPDQWRTQKCQQFLDSLNIAFIKHSCINNIKLVNVITDKENTKIEFEFMIISDDNR